MNEEVIVNDVEEVEDVEIIDNDFEVVEDEVIE